VTLEKCWHRTLHSCSHNDNTRHNLHNLKLLKLLTFAKMRPASAVNYHWPSSSSCCSLVSLSAFHSYFNMWFFGWCRSLQVKVTSCISVAGLWFFFWCDCSATAVIFMKTSAKDVFAVLSINGSTPMKIGTPKNLRGSKRQLLEQKFRLSKMAAVWKRGGILGKLK